MEFMVYHGDREFAREHKDPCLGTVHADDKETALKKLAKCEFATRTTAPLIEGVGFHLVEVLSESFLDEELGG